MTFRARLRKIKLLKFMASMKIAITGLVLLFILTFWGTLAQVQTGLYLAQEKYFESFFFLAGGFFPFPGAQLVMWVLFFNLISVMLVRFVYTKRNIGILIIHFGLLLFLISGYVIMHAATESHLTLREGEAKNFSSAFDLWELAVWDKESDQDPLQSEHAVIAFDIDHLNEQKKIFLDSLGLTFTLQTYYRNAHAYTDSKDKDLLNASRIGRLEEIGLDIEPERNTPGIIFEVSASDSKASRVLLYGGENKPTPIQVGAKDYYLSMRFKRYPLPFLVKLIDFIKEDHPGTQMARSFKSRIDVQTNGVWREKLIYMNNPMRYKDYTFYQASFSIDASNNEISTLAVVKNSGQWLPYIATLVTFLGLVIHFIMMGFYERKRSKRA